MRVDILRVDITCRHKLRRLERIDEDAWGPQELAAVRVVLLAAVAWDIVCRHEV